jgi:hypothetical protein
MRRTSSTSSGGRKTKLVLAAASVAAFAVAPLSAAAPQDVWKNLHRPLHLPVVAASAPCPVSAMNTEFDFGKYGVQNGIGRGPAYPIGFEQPGSILNIAVATDRRSVFYGSRWSGQKVLWFVSPAYRGPVLIRGRQLDGANLVRFEGAGLRVPPAELRITKNMARAGGAAEYGQRERPSYTRLLGPGCYAYQVDGTTFSRTIVFRAKLES